MYAFKSGNVPKNSPTDKVLSGKNSVFLDKLTSKLKKQVRKVRKTEW